MSVFALDRLGATVIDWAEFSSVFGAVGPTVVALAVVILNRRDRLADKVQALADKVQEISERVARIEGILVNQDT